jgi:hypothetical protein
VHTKAKARRVHGLRRTRDNEAVSDLLRLDAVLVNAIAENTAVDKVLRVSKSNVVIGSNITRPPVSTMTTRFQ